MAEPYKHVYKVDLNEPLKRFDIGDILASGDEKANSFEVAVCRDGASVDLAGCAVYGYFIRPNEETMKVNGTVEGNWARVELSKSCYVYDGAFSLAIKITGNSITQTVAVFDGLIVKTTSDSIVDGNRVLYGLEDLLAQIAATEAAAVNANTAASNANKATTNANTAANNANKWANATAKATAISAESQPTVGVSESNGNKVINFGIPAGKTPNITFKVATGEPGTPVQIKQSGTPEAPVINLTIPRGDTGAVDGVDYFTGNPSALGAASPGTANGVARGDHVHPLPTAQAIGALPTNGTAYNAERFGGMLPSEYASEDQFQQLVASLNQTIDAAYAMMNEMVKASQAPNLLVNSDFTNPVNQRGLTQLTGLQGTAHTYGLIDRWLCYGSGTVFTVENGCIKAVNNGNATCGIVQRVENGVIKAGKKYTLACKATVGASARLSYGAGLNVHTHQIDLNAANEIHTHTFTASESTEGAHIVRLCTLANAQTFKVEWMALYEGEYTADTLPPYVPRGYAQELAECQRYFVRIGGNAAYTHIGLAHAQNDTQLICSAPLPQPMRKVVTPSVIKGGEAKMTAKSGTTFKDISSVMVNQTGVGAIALTLTSAGLTKGDVFDVYVPTGSWLDISADL